MEESSIPTLIAIVARRFCYRGDGRYVCRHLGIPADVVFGVGNQRLRD